MQNIEKNYDNFENDHMKCDAMNECIAEPFINKELKIVRKNNFKQKCEIFVRILNHHIRKIEN